MNKLKLATRFVSYLVLFVATAHLFKSFFVALPIVIGNNVIFTIDEANYLIDSFANTIVYTLLGLFIFYINVLLPMFLKKCKKIFQGIKTVKPSIE